MSTGSTKVRLTQAQQELVLKTLPLVQRVANHMRKTILRGADRAELVAWGRLGLVEAAVTYDPTVLSENASFPFETFAWSRVRFAMLDNAEGAGLIPRKAYHRRVRKLIEDVGRLHDQMGDFDETDEQSLERIRAAVRDVGTCWFIGSSLPTIERSVEDDALAAECLRKIEMVAASLSEEERELFELRFREEVSLRDISARMGTPYMTIRRRFQDLLQTLRVRLERAGVTRSADLGTLGE